MKDLQTITKEIDALVYSQSVVVKLLCPFTVTIAQRVPLATWKMCVYWEDSFSVWVIPVRTPAEEWQPLFREADFFKSESVIL